MSFTISGTNGLTFPNATTQNTAAVSSVPAGAITNFANAAAPTGWTQVTTYNDYAMRIVSGTGGGTGGSVGFTTAFTSQSVTGTTDATTLSLSQIPSHNHFGSAVQVARTVPDQSAPFRTYVSFTNNVQGTGTTTATSDSDGTTGFRVASNGSGGSHTHSFSSTAINLAVQYVDNILCVKN